MEQKITIRLDAKVWQTAELKERLRQTIDVTSLRIERGAKERIQQGAKTGRTYRLGAIRKSVGQQTATEFAQLGLRRTKGSSGDARQSFAIGARIHRASAPGEAPASRTGNLVNSIQKRDTVETAERITGGVGVGAEYGGIEKGMGRVKPRPYLAPALASEKEQFVADVKAIVSG